MKNFTEGKEMQKKQADQGPPCLPFRKPFCGPDNQQLICEQKKKMLEILDHLPQVYRLHFVLPHVLFTNI